MKKIISVLILVCMTFGMIVGTFSITASAAATREQLVEKTAEARDAYFSGGSEQTRKYLYSKIAIADATLANPTSSSSKIDSAYTDLVKALELFQPITISDTCAINGVGYWTEDQVAAMSAEGLEASVSTAVKASEASQSLALTLKDSEGMFINLPGEDGAYSPFALDTNASNGLMLWLAASDYTAIDAIDVYVGKKNDGAENLLSVYDVPVSQEGYVYIPWEIFYPELNDLNAKLDLSGGMNRLGFGVRGQAGATVYVSDVKAYCEIIESDDRDYKEVPVASISELNSGEDDLYKISDPATGKVVTWGPELTEKDYKKQASSSRLDWTASYQSFTLEDNNGKDITQQWQIHKMLRNDNYRIVNQGTSATMTVSPMDTLTLQNNSDLNNTKQQFHVTENSGKFVFKVGNMYLTIKSGIPALGYDPYEWDVIACKSEDWVLVWGDEFNGTNIDRTKWNVANSKVRSSGSEPATFRDDPNNIYLKDGNLVIRTVKEEYGGYHATSGYMDTQGFFGVTYGKFELRAKLTDGNRSWPAFWSMGNNGNWPMNGELDMMEFDINPNDATSANSIYGTNHWFNYLGNLNGTDTSNDYLIHAAKGTTLYNENGENFAEDFHTFTVEWDETQCRTYLDGMLYMSMLLKTDELRWSFGDNPHYLILNVSTKGPGNNQVYADMADETFMYVDYVRVYKRASEVADVPQFNDEVVSGKNVVTADGGWMCNITASPDGKYVASTDRWNVYLTDQKDNKQLSKTYYGHSEVSSVKFSDDSSKLIVAERSGHISVYSVPEMKELCHSFTNCLYIESAAIDNENRYVYFGGRNTDEGKTSVPKSDPALAIYKMDVATGASSLAYTSGSNARALEFSPDGTKLAAACANGNIILFSIGANGNLTQLATFTDHVRCARGLAWSPDSKKLATTDEGGKVFVYDAENLCLKHEAQNVSVASIRTAAYSPDGTKLLVSGSADCARIFDAETGKLLNVIGGFTQCLTAAEWSHDGSKILLTSYDGYGRIYTANGEYLKTISAVQKDTLSIKGAVFSGDGTKVYGINDKPRVNTVCWEIGDEVDVAPLTEALVDAYNADPADYSARDYAVIEQTIDKFKRCIRMACLSTAEDVAAAAAEVRCAIALKDGEVFGFDSWQTSDVSPMTVTKCKLTMRPATDAVDAPNALYIYSTGTSWNFNNKVGEDIFRNPYVLDLRDYSGLKFKAFANKAVTGCTVTLGYRGDGEDTVFSYNVGGITTAEAEYTIPFAALTRVSGDEKLDLSKLELIGFACTGKSMTGITCYDLATYRDAAEMPVISGVTEGAEYNLATDGAPVITWDVGRGELNGKDVESGVAVNDAGEYTIRVINLDKVAEINFTVKSEAVAIRGDLDHDGVITVSDALRCLRIAAKVVLATPDMVTAADIDRDGSATAADALAILRVAVELADASTLA